MTSGANSSTSGGGQTGTDPTTISQSGQAGTPPSPPAAPSLTAASSHSGSFAQGDGADSYSLRVSNAAGAGPTSGMVVVTDTPPAGLTPTSSCRVTGWTCSLARATCCPARGEPGPTFEP